MKGHRLKAWLTMNKLQELCGWGFSFRIVPWIASLAIAGLSGGVLSAQEARVEPQTQDTRKCDPFANRKAQEEGEKTFMKWGRYRLALEPRRSEPLRSYL